MICDYKNNHDYYQRQIINWLKMQPSRQEQGQGTITFSFPVLGVQKTLPNNMGSLLTYKQIISMSTQFYLFNNFYFQHKGVRLNQVEPISQIKFTNQKQYKIDIAFAPFQYMTAQYHVAKFMEAVFNPEIYAYLLKNQFINDKTDKTGENNQINPINFDIQNIKPDLNHGFLTMQSQIQRKVNLLMSISMSGFNPAPTSSKLNGDLFYIHARTLQGQDIHITASPGGFYVNQSKISCFNPTKSSVHKGVYGSLIDLFKNISEKFKENLQKFVSQTKVTESMKYKFHSLNKISKKYWLQSLDYEHGWSQRKNMDDHVSNLVYQLRDWNQMFQSQAQMLQQMEKDQNNQLNRLINLSKVYSQFQVAAIQGATYIIDGKISPLNPTDDKKKHIYIYNKIFFSIASETVYDHSQQKGQDATPSSSAINTDLINIQILNNLNIPDLRVLHMIIVNYRGYKVIAQCIIPGILSVDHIYCSQYGSIDDGKTIQTNPQFEKIMIQVCQRLNIEDNIQVIDGNGVKKRIAGSPDIKGILGSDKRKYILDLLRLSPRDLNYEGIQNQTCVLRPELVKHYKKSRQNEKLCKINVNIGTDIKYEKSQSHSQQLSILQDMASYLRKISITNLIETLKNYPSQYLTNNEGITRAFHYWGVNMRYLGQVCNHESIKEQIQIKLVLQRVIAVRAIKHLFRMAMREGNIMHLGATLVWLFNCVFGRKAHILCMEEGAVQAEETNDKNTDKQPKKKKKKKNKELQSSEANLSADPSLCSLINTIKIPPNKYLLMKPSQIWQQVRAIALARFKYELPKSQTIFQVFKYPFQKLATLRDLCLAIGVVLQRKNYDIFESSNSGNDKILPFNCRNIVQINPRTKKMKIQPQNLQQREKQTQKLITNYQVKQALKLDSVLQKQNIDICGGLNQTAVKLFTRMGRILYILGENKSAIAQEQKNLSMLQSIHSQDYWLNIQTHINLGLYYIAAGDKNKVVYYMMKGIYLMLVAFGETSPDLLVSFANLARIYQMNKQYKEAIKCYKVAIKFVQQIHGKFHVKMSFCYTALATISHQMNDLKSAIEYQTQNVGILNKILPDNDFKFIDALKILKMYRQMYQKSEMHSSFANFARVMQSMMVQQEQKQPKQTKKKGKKN